MRYFLIVFTLSVWLSGAAWGIDPVQITVTRKLLDNIKTRYEHSKTEQKIIAYKVEVANHTSKELQNLTVKYTIFFSDTHFANTQKPVIKPIVGKFQISALSTRKPAEFETEPLALETATWDSDYRYKSGVTKAQDKIIGIWFKVFDAQGKQLVEYAEPISVPKEQKWLD